MIRVVHPGSRIQGSKRHPISDPGSGSATLLLLWCKYSLTTCAFQSDRDLLSDRTSAVDSDPWIRIYKCKMAHTKNWETSASGVGNFFSSIILILAWIWIQEKPCTGIRIFLPYSKKKLHEMYYQRSPLVKLTEKPESFKEFKKILWLRLKKNGWRNERKLER
jgi:hypothetical protein